MLARRLTTILPAMTLVEALETTRIHRVAGRTGDCTAFITIRPFRAAHHPIADIGLIGGGQIPMPGEGSLAHRGFLFLDELPEFKHHPGWRCAGSGSRRASHGYNLLHVLDLTACAALARLVTSSGLGRAW
jgi:hypothetical protein